MKLVVVSFNLDMPGGGNVLLFSFAQALQKLGHHVSIYAPGVDKNVFPKLQKGLDIQAIPPKSPLLWKSPPDGLLGKIRYKIAQEKLQADAARRIALRLRDLDIDVLILCDYALKVGYFCKIAGNHRPRPILWIMNEPPYQYLHKGAFIYDAMSKIYNSYKEFSAKRYFRSIDGVVVLVDRYKEWAEKHGMSARVIRSGIDFEKFYSPPKVTVKKTIEVLSIGMLNRYRRFEDTVRAARILRERGFDVRVKIIAKDLSEDGVYQKELVNFVDKEGMGLFTELNFRGVSEANLPKIYARADFFVLPLHLPPPRRGYGWQLVGFEAMAAGTPTIVCRSLDVVEVLKDRETAMFARPEDPEDIANKIQTMIENPNLYAKIARAGQEFVRKNMSWEKYARELIAFADEMREKGNLS